MMNRHVYAREQDAGGSVLPVLRTVRQESLVQEGVRGNTVKTFTRF